MRQGAGIVHEAGSQNRWMDALALRECGVPRTAMGALVLSVRGTLAGRDRPSASGSAQPAQPDKTHATRTAEVRGRAELWLSPAQWHNTPHGCCIAHAMQE